MEAYRSRYAELAQVDARVLAVSSDSEETQKRFKDKVGARFSFVADPEGKLIEQFGVKAPMVTIAKRYTFVIGTGRELLDVDSGSDAIDPGNVIEALKRAR